MPVKVTFALYLWKNLCGKPLKIEFIRRCDLTLVSRWIYRRPDEGYNNADISVGLAL